MGKIAFLFAGQGAQYPGMGQSLYETYPAAKAVFDLSDSMRPGTSQLCFSGTKEALTITENTQPCVYSVDLAAAEALRSSGIEPDAVAGFSLGEVAALTFAGAFTPRDGFSLVCRRAALMQQAAEAHPSKMAAVLKLSNETVEHICEELGGLYPVNYNCPGQLSVAGSAEQLTSLCAAVKEAGGRATVLAVSGGFHSPFMASAAAAFLPEITGFSAPRIPVYANRTAAPYEGPDAALLASQIDHPVRWEQTIRAMGQCGIDTFIEVGPGKTLTGLVRRILPEAALYHCDSAELAQSIQLEVTNATE